MISSQTKNFYITSSMPEISSIHRFILEIKQILESQDKHIFTDIFDQTQ